MQSSVNLTTLARSRIAIAWAIGHAHLFPFSVRDRAARLFASPEYCPVVPFTVDFFGQRYSGQLDSFIDWSVFMFGAYEEAVSKLMIRVLREGFSKPPVVWDVGANCGHHTLLLAPHAEHVHAFEPVPSLCDSIAAKVRENELHNITIHRFGLGAKNATLPFVPSPDRNLGTGAFCQPGDQPQPNVATTYLPIISGDALVAAGAAAPQFLKIDVQEFEYQVLLGMHDTLQASPPVIVLEYCNRLASQTDGLRRGKELLGVNYSWYDIEHSLGGGALKPFHYSSAEAMSHDFVVHIIGIPEERATHSRKCFSVVSNHRADAARDQRAGLDRGESVLTLPTTG